MQILAVHLNFTREIKLTVLKIRLYSHMYIKFQLKNLTYTIRYSNNHPYAHTESCEYSNMFSLSLAHCKNSPLALIGRVLDVDLFN